MVALSTVVSSLLLILGFVSDASTCVPTASNSCASFNDEDNDQVHLMQLTSALSPRKRSKTGLAASVLRSLEHTQFGVEVTQQDLEEAFALASTTSHVNETGLFPPFSVMGYTVLISNASLAHFNLTQIPSITFNNTAKTVNLAVGFKVAGGLTVTVQQPKSSHFVWCCYFSDKASPDLVGHAGIDYDGEYTLTAGISLNGQKQPVLQIHDNKISRSTGGCDLTGNSVLGFVMDLAEQQLCDLVEGGSNTALRTAAISATDLLSDVTKYIDDQLSKDQW
jgi:hypothetical protein